MLSQILSFRHFRIARRLLKYQCSNCLDALFQWKESLPYLTVRISKTIKYFSIETLP